MQQFTAAPVGVTPGCWPPVRPGDKCAAREAGGKISTGPTGVCTTHGA